MADAAIGSIFDILGWSFIPNYATSFLQTFYYRLTVPVGVTPPQPGTQAFATHYRRIRIFVLSLYLIYTLAQSLYDIKLTGDFFTLLSVSPSSSEREIKSKFRRLAAKYHPDKVSSQGMDAVDAPSSDGRFLAIKLAQDVLLNPSLRYAYLRFGPVITTLQAANNKIPNIRSYVYAGLLHTLLPSYLLNVVTLMVMNYLVLPRWGTYWRYLLLTAIATIELYLLTHSDASLTTILPVWISIPSELTYTILRTKTKLGNVLPPHLLPFQVMSVLRKLSMSLNIFISQLAPPRQQMQLPASGDKPNVQLLSSLNQSLGHLLQAAQRTDAESTGLLSQQLNSFKGHVQEVEELREGMRESMVMGALQNHPEIKAAINNAKARQRTGMRRRERDDGRDEHGM